MSDYITIVNDGLAEISETPIVSGSFDAARGIQNTAKKFLNRAYFDIVNESLEWPWLHETISRVEGTKVLDLVVGIQWYDFDSSQMEVDWHTFYMTLKDPEVPSTAVTDESKVLTYITYEQWHRAWRSIDNQRTVEVRATPKYVIRHPNGKIGVSPVPDKIYYLEYNVWESGTRFVAASDLVPFEEQFESVLLARLLYYLWKSRDNLENARLSNAEFKTGLKNMKRILLSNKNERMRAV